MTSEGGKAYDTYPRPAVVTIPDRWEQPAFPPEPDSGPPAGSAASPVVVPQGPRRSPRSSRRPVHAPRGFSAGVTGHPHLIGFVATAVGSLALALGGIASGHAVLVAPAIMSGMGAAWFAGRGIRHAVRPRTREGRS